MNKPSGHKKVELKWERCISHKRSNMRVITKNNQLICKLLKKNYVMEQLNLLDNATHQFFKAIFVNHFKIFARKLKQNFQGITFIWTGLIPENFHQI